MENRIIIKAGLKRHKSVFTGIFILIFLISITVSTVLSVWISGRDYMTSEMNRAGFGEVTAWVSNSADLTHLKNQILALEEVENVTTQNLILAEYQANNQESDSEGQLILYEEKENRYRFFQSGLSGYLDAPEEIKQGEVYLSPAMISMMDLKIGDIIQFPIARNGITTSLTVAGYYEDPFMGSSMIGMKGFLISQEDYLAIRNTIEETGIDALARNGAMLHLFADKDSHLTSSKLNQVVNQSTELPLYTEFIYSQNAILGYMLILQNAFCGLLIAFAGILLLTALMVIQYSISGLIEQDYTNFGILKTMGVYGSRLIKLCLIQYMTAVIPAMLAGIFAGIPLSSLINRITLTTTGILIPNRISILPCLSVFLGILILLILFLYGKLQKINEIAPVQAIRRNRQSQHQIPKRTGRISHFCLEMQLAVRQLIFGKRQYASACMVAALLVFFASLTGRIDGWLGEDGQGMMEAFHPAGLDIGIQVFGELDMDQVEQTILEYTAITDHYLLAMPDVSVDGINYSANVITEPERFHIQRGTTCIQDSEIVITETVAKDFGVVIGDTLTIRGNRGSSDYTISGIYQCANDMGNNIGMNREGYLKIGQDTESLWCFHYFLENPSVKSDITERLEQAYKGDIHIHENTWPGLLGILAAMDGLIGFLSVAIVLFVLIVTIMTGSRMIFAEQKDMGIYQSMGFSVRQLRILFAFRFFLVAFSGSVIGTGFASLFTDPFVSSVLKFAGITNFASSLSIGQMLFPLAMVTLLFTYFSWLVAGKIKKTNLNLLIQEEG